MVREKDGDWEKKDLLKGEILSSIKVRRNQWNNPRQYRGRGKPKGKLSCRYSCHTVVRVELYRRGHDTLHSLGTIGTPGYSCASVLTCFWSGVFCLCTIEVEKYHSAIFIMQVSKESCCWF